MYIYHFYAECKSLNGLTKVMRDGIITEPNRIDSSSQYDGIKARIMAALKHYHQDLDVSTLFITSLSFLHKIEG